MKECAMVILFVSFFISTGLSLDLQYKLQSIISKWMTAVLVIDFLNTYFCALLSVAWIVDDVLDWIGSKCMFAFTRIRLRNP